MSGSGGAMPPPDGSLPQGVVSQGLQQGGMIVFEGDRTLFAHADPSTGAHASLDEVQALLEKSKAIGRVRLAFTNRSDATYVCDPSNVLEVEFLTELGDLPALRWRHAKGSHLAQPDINVTVTELVKGTKEDLECAQMGVCNRDTGHCYCMPGLASSSAEVMLPYLPPICSPNRSSQHARDAVTRHAAASRRESFIS